jgi:DNA-binding NarL/FixJ family response regulator
VVIIDDRKLIRQGLIALFTSEPGILIVGDGADGLDAVKLVESKRPDVVVLNIRLPKLDGVSAARRINKLIPKPEFIFLTGCHNEIKMREAFRAGARAYLLQNCDFKELVFAIRKASVGDYYLSGPAGHEMVLEFLNPGEEGSKIPGILTARESELAALLAGGYSTKEAADMLDISVKTAETHRSTIMRKIKAKNVTDIVKYCIRNDLIEP